MNKISIIIELDEKGVVSVIAPVENRILCYGMLKVAEQIIEKGVPAKESKIIQPRLDIIPQ